MTGRRCVLGRGALMLFLCALLLTTGGCTPLAALDVSTISGMWALIGLYLCYVCFGGIVYLIFCLLAQSAMRRDRAK